MNPGITAPLLSSDSVDGSLLGLARLMTLAFHGEDLTPLGQALLERVGSTPEPSSANALMDVATILHLKGNREVALRMQEAALQMKQLYQLPAKKQPALRLLALYAQGDLGSNTPLEFLVENSDIEMNILYVTEALAMPDHLPPHDVLFVAIGESKQNRTLLRHLETIIPTWPKPVLNMPDRILRVARDAASQLLHSAPGLNMPLCVQSGRPILELVARGQQHISCVQDALDFPVIIRPVGSHAGIGLIKAGDAGALFEYLQKMPQNEFYVTRFIDYRGTDGLFRKYRVVLIDGQPHASHMAISQDWMIHYLNACMENSPDKRAEEARFMECFDEDFAYRHRVALQSIAERIGLDYLVIDCAETPDGKLLVFEVDSNAVVHAMDPVELFPYKNHQMNRVFAAFRAMLVKAIERN
jgi:glutathione synthase/RimK-type ligase-like ATP-grasp enzyme